MKADLNPNVLQASGGIVGALSMASFLLLVPSLCGHFTFTFRDDRNCTLHFVILAVVKMLQVSNADCVNSCFCLWKKQLVFFINFCYVLQIHPF